LVNASMAEPESRVPFQQAGIGVEKREEFAQLHSALERIFAADAVEKYLRLLRSKGVPIRDFDRVLREKLLEQTDQALGKSGRSARQWYDALSVGDQAQVREFYLTALEAVDLPLREKFKQLYRYY
jgi:DNA-binding transcriptional ArsR family regulator